MNKKLETKLIGIARALTKEDDPSHDFDHSLRVLENAKRILKTEGGDPDIVIPAALFHDIVMIPKHHPKAHLASDKSAIKTKKILKSLPEFPQQKIDKVCSAIATCSFSKAIMPTFLEAKILQDADGLEATGAISIMRTYSSTGQMKRKFYQPDDPFCQKRQPDSKKYGLDLFFVRLLKVIDRMHTQTAKKIARRRTKFLETFLKELKLELAEHKS